MIHGGIEEAPALTVEGVILLGWRYHQVIMDLLSQAHMAVGEAMPTFWNPQVSTLIHGVARGRRRVFSSTAGREILPIARERWTSHIPRGRRAFFAVLVDDRGLRYPRVSHRQVAIPHPSNGVGRCRRRWATAVAGRLLGRPPHWPTGRLRQGFARTELSKPAPARRRGIVKTNGCCHPIAQVVLPISTICSEL